VRIVRKRHPFEGRELAVLGWMRRHGSLELCLVLPDGSKSLIPAAWTDLDAAAQPEAGGTIGSLSDLLRAAAVAGGLVRRLEQTDRDDRPVGEQEVGSAVEPGVVRDPPPPVAWEALTPDERVAAVAALARVMAKSINNEEEDHE